MIILKCPTWIDNSCLERAMLVIQSQKLHVLLLKELTQPLMWRITWPLFQKIPKLSLMMDSGSPLTLLSMPLIISKLDYMLILNVFSIKNLFLSQEHLELKLILKWSFHSKLNAMEILKIHQRNLSQCAPLETSQIKLSIALNGAEINLTSISSMSQVISNHILRTQNCLLLSSKTTVPPQVL